MKEKFTIPKLNNTSKYWYVHFRHEGKQWRFTDGLNKIKNLREREIEYNGLCWELLQKLRKGWSPNKVEKINVLSFNMFSKQEKTNFLNELINNNNNNLKVNKKSKTIPKHENIFCNNGFELFEYILNEYVKTNRGRLSDIHFFYWSMYDNSPQLIHQRPERFKEWFIDNYKEDLGKIKIYDDVKNNDRLIHYSNALDWFKLKKY